MRKFLILSLVLCSIFIIIISAHILYLKSMAAEETYPEDTWLAAEEVKRALIIVAHDDDMATSAGTITRLCRSGWTVREMCFYQQGGMYFKKDSAKNPIRKVSLKQVADIQGFEGVDPIDFNFRKDMETEKAYMPMPYEMLNENYHTDSLYAIIGAYIEKHKPSVIFTLDNVFGGYGHPDHVIISRIIHRYCTDHKDEPGFTVKRIYQPVFSPSLSRKVMGKMPVYNEARKVYGVEGSPVPDVQVTVADMSRIKKDVFKAYVSEQNSFRQIWPYYNWYPHWIYFRIFDRDFYSVININ